MPDSFAAATAPPLDSAFAALGDPVRRALVSRLARGDATVSELAEPFGLTQQPNSVTFPKTFPGDILLIFLN